MTATPINRAVCLILFGLVTPMIVPRTSVAQSPLTHKDAGSVALPPNEPAKGATSQPAEMPVDSVIDAFRDEAAKIGIGPEDDNEVTGWLRAVLSHPHRRIDEASLDSFRSSLKTFCANSGADFRKHREDSDTLLKFCCDIAWSRRVGGDSTILLDEYKKLNHGIIRQITLNIETGLPVDKQEQWKGKIEAAMSNVQDRLDHSVQQLSGDFLFPGFKDHLSAGDLAKGKALGDSGGGKNLMPQYGEIRELMQTRDESFQSQLDNFSKYFVPYYCDTLCFHQIVRQSLQNDRWKSYNLSSNGSSDGWPMVLRLSPQNPSTTRPSAERAQ
jgi:hypothetical protein